MLENITVALQAFANTYEGATRIWKTTRKDIESNYAGNLKTQKMNEAKNVYESTISQSRDNNFSDCLNVLESIREQAMKVVSTPVDSNFSSAIEVLKVMNEPTKTEIDAIVGQYKYNYFSYRVICDVLGGKEKGYSVTTIDDVMDAAAALESKLRDCFYGNGGSPERYIYRLMLQGDYIGKYDEFFSAFIEGRFDDAGTIVNESK